MTTPLQTAAQAVIDRWNSPVPMPTGTLIAELRKALDAELQQSVEPVLWITELDDPIICKTEFEAATFCEDDQRPIPVYLHPPQQAVTSGERAELIAQLIRKADAWDYLHPTAKRPNVCRQAADMLEADAQQAKQVPMTDEQIEAACRFIEPSFDGPIAYDLQIARAIEAHHGIGGEA